jgi:hypothetical protein
MSIKFFYNFCLKDGDDTVLRDDILCGVRRSYFGNFEKLKDRITVNSEDAPVVYDFSIEKDKPMRWMVRSAKGETLQETIPSDNGKYYIYFYQGQAVLKRVLFSRMHTLLRVEYYDTSNGIQTITLEPRKAPTGICILYSSRVTPQPIVLYAAPGVSDPRVAAMVREGFTDYMVQASTNDGELIFLSDEQMKAYKEFIQNAEDAIANEKEETFVDGETPLYDRVNAKDFNVRRNLSSALDITQAEEFSVSQPEDVAPAETAEESFDAVAEAADVVEEAAGTAPETVEPVEETVPAEEPAELTDISEPEPEEEPVEYVESVEADDLTEEITEEITEEEPAAEIEPEPVEESAPAEEEVPADEPDSAPAEVFPAQPDKLIMADGAMYSYYGTLDEQGNRSGYGRTVTEEGLTAYEGCYVNDKRSGKGTYYYKNGALCYTGDWTENVRHGVGVGVSSSDGSIHTGRWQYNRPVGSGVRMSADGDIRFVCKELGDGTTVLINFLPDDSIMIAKYDENGMKLGEEKTSLIDFLK